MNVETTIVYKTSLQSYIYMCSAITIAFFYSNKSITFTFLLHLHIKVCMHFRFAKFIDNKLQHK